MAIYNNGNHKFDKTFINSFKEPEIRSYLRYKRSQNFHDYRDSICTLEQILYNNSPQDLHDEIYWYCVGHIRSRNSIEKQITSFISTRKILNILKDIHKEMHQKNNWGLDHFKEQWKYIPV